MATTECNRRSQAWRDFRSAVWRLKPHQLASFDYCGALRDVDAVADVPIPQLMAFLFASHSDARVILTARSSSEWYPRRVQWKGGTDMAPFFWFTTAAISDTLNGWGNVGRNVQVTDDLPLMSEMRSDD